MSWRYPTTDEITQILSQVRTVAVVGVSDNPERASYGVAQYLLEHSNYEIYFINPMIKELFGKPVYATLGDVPVTIDLVDVFRKISDLPEVFAAALAINAKVIWTQLGLVDLELAELAHQSAVKVVLDKCLKIEHEKRAIE